MIPRDRSNPAYIFNSGRNEGQDSKVVCVRKDAGPIALLKYSTPDSSWTCYVLELDPDENLCFGLVIGHESELGYFFLTELETIRGPMGLPIERDLHFEPKPVSECK